MPNYHRYYGGGIYFFTVVTNNRIPILTSNTSRKILHDTFDAVNSKWPFSTIAICLLPDHIHCLWELPKDDQNYSLRWNEIKKRFSQNYSGDVKSSIPLSESRMKRGEASLWQRRFWEHSIRDENDLANHINYIHYNPVKHGLVQQVRIWPWSSFHKYVEEGFYDPDWGQADCIEIQGE